MCSSVLESLINKERESLDAVGYDASGQEILLELPEEPQILDLLLGICYGNEDAAGSEQTEDLMILKQKYNLRYEKIKEKEIAFIYKGKQYRYQGELSSLSSNGDVNNFEE